MFIVLTNVDNVLDELIAVEVDRKIATSKFLDACETCISNWDEFTPEDIDDILDVGYVHFGGTRAVVMIDISNEKCDSEIMDEIEDSFDLQHGIKRTYVEDHAKDGKN